MYVCIHKYVQKGEVMPLIVSLCSGASKINDNQLLYVDLN